MSGKCRPSLRAKTLLSVARSNLSTADKKCIHAVFARADEQELEIARLQSGVTEQHNAIAEMIKQGKAKAVKEFALELKRIPRISVYKNEIDNLLREKVGDK